MGIYGPTRRDVLAGVMAAAPLAAGAHVLAAGTAAAPPQKQPRSPMIGLATLGFSELTNAELAQELSREGIKLVQLFFNQKDSRYWKYNGRSDVSTLTPDRCREIGQAYRSAGVEIHSIGVYTNLIHPDAAERKANLAYFEAMMKIGAAMGVRRFVTEAGHHHIDGKQPPVEYHFQEETWKMMVATGKELAQLAQANGATVLLEAFYRGFLATAKRVRMYLEEIGSPNIRSLLDPANLLEVNDLDEMFAQLSPYIDCIHAKDRKLHVDRGVAAGQGDLDYNKFVKLARQCTPHAPLVLEYVGSKDYKQALAHLKKAIEATEK